MFKPYKMLRRNLYKNEGVKLQIDSALEDRLKFGDLKFEQG